MGIFSVECIEFEMNSASSQNRSLLEIELGCNDLLTEGRSLYLYIVSKR